MAGKNAQRHIGPWKTSAKGHLHIDANGDEQTDLTRWRLDTTGGRQAWRYLESDTDCEQWPPQNYAEKYHLGLDEKLLPDVAPAKTPSQSIKIAVSHLSKLQLPSGHWAGEVSGPLFLIPITVIAWYVTNTPIPPEYAVEMRRYVFSRQSPQDGGWPWQTESDVTTNFATVLNYVALRLLGADKDDRRMMRARKCLHSLGGAGYAAATAKFWLCVLGVMEWSGVNPFVPDIWLAKPSDTTAPWNWTTTLRTVFAPLSYVWSRRWSHPLDELTTQLRAELYPDPSYDSINFSAYRNAISASDNRFPKHWLVNLMNFLTVWLYLPLLRSTSTKQQAEERAWEFVHTEDENTNYIGLSIMSSAANLVATYVREGEDGESVEKHREKQSMYPFMTRDGMLINLGDGSQTWEVALIVQTFLATGLAEDPGYRVLLQKCLEFLDEHQFQDNVPNQDRCFRQHRKGGWPMSIKEQGYMVTDVTGEAFRSVLLLQEEHNFSHLISDRRLQDAVDCMLLLQNDTGGFYVYEKRRGRLDLEWMESSEFTAKNLVSYDFVECAASVLTSLALFQRHHPKYRADDIQHAIDLGLRHIRTAQDQDGGWWAVWGICYVFGAMWALEFLATIGESYDNSAHARRGCDFLVAKQKDDGGWGESYKSLAADRYVQHEESQTVQTAWACLALLYAQYPDSEVVARGIKLLMQRQTAKGQWERGQNEGGVGIGTVSFSNYALYWPVRAMGEYMKRHGDGELQ